MLTKKIDRIRFYRLLRHPDRHTGTFFPNVSYTSHTSFMLMYVTEWHKHQSKSGTQNTLIMKNNHNSTWHVIMLILSDIISISFSLYLKGNVTYKYTTNVHTLQARTTMSNYLYML